MRLNLCLLTFVSNITVFHFFHHYCRHHHHHMIYIAYKMHWVKLSSKFLHNWVVLEMKKLWLSLMLSWLIVWESTINTDCSHSSFVHFIFQTRVLIKYMIHKMTLINHMFIIKNVHLTFGFEVSLILLDFQSLFVPATWTLISSLLLVYEDLFYIVYHFKTLKLNIHGKVYNKLLLVFCLVTGCCSQVYKAHKHKEGKL